MIISHYTPISDWERVFVIFPRSLGWSEETGEEHSGWFCHLDRRWVAVASSLGPDIYPQYKQQSAAHGRLPEEKP